MDGSGRAIGLLVPEIEDQTKREQLLTKAIGIINGNTS